MINYDKRKYGFNFFGQEYYYTTLKYKRFWLDVTHTVTMNLNKLPIQIRYT